MEAAVRRSSTGCSRGINGDGGEAGEGEQAPFTCSSASSESFCAQKQVAKGEEPTCGICPFPLHFPSFFPLARRSSPAIQGLTGTESRVRCSQQVLQLSRRPPLGPREDAKEEQQEKHVDGVRISFCAAKAREGPSALSTRLCLVW